MSPAHRTRGGGLGRAAIAAVLAAALLAPGCTAGRRVATTAPGVLVATGAPSAAELAEVAAARRRSLHALRATGKLQVTVDATEGSEARRQRLSASQSLLARAPDSFRLEVLTPFGVGYVVAADGASIAAYAPGERVLWRGDADLRTVAATTGVAAEPSDVVALLLGVAPVPPLDLARARVSRASGAGEGSRGASGDDDAPELLLHATVRDRPDDLVVVGYARPTAASGAWVPVLFERTTIEGDLVLRARFGDFAASPAGPVARRVEIEAGGSKAVLRCSGFEVNPAIDATAFSIPTPPGVREQRLVDPATAGSAP
ncbi:MAG: hypothetical protein ACKPBU_12240 [Alphaproteobacteria bacterium]